MIASWAETFKKRRMYGVSVLPIVVTEWNKEISKKYVLNYQILNVEQDIICTGLL
jgi:hypothetical protein